MASANQKVFYVHKKARDQIPRRIKIFKHESESSNGFSNEVKWSKEYTSYKLKSVLPTAGYGKGFLEVVYEMIDKT